MWNRLGPEEVGFQEDAAFVFKCLLEWKDQEIRHPPLCFHLTLFREKASGAMLKELASRKMDFYTSPRILMVEFIHRTLRDFLLQDGQSLLEKHDAEAVYAAMFKALIGEAMIKTGSRPAEFDVFYATRILLHRNKGLWNRSSLRIVESQCGYRMIWLPKSQDSLDTSLRCCRRWMQYTRRLRAESYAATGLSHGLSRDTIKWLNMAFETHSMTNFLEQMEIHLDDVKPTLQTPFPIDTISTYLVWQRLDRAGMTYWGYGVPEDHAYREMFTFVDMKWA
ncbi:hypothetical protein EJ04DRAFT_524578 [Polyplosphaeria fusca]|uniref:Uncharacterized protein n=1 Tax=Polyplosphaeria fusca TaxID=682080 RepID=A0A9P4QY72_9PLEO|nr:hypothetical protein EJ04DRAFT_524578 [Polyplosphaeria fusca]